MLTEVLTSFEDISRRLVASRLQLELNAASPRAALTLQQQELLGEEQLPELIVRPEELWAGGPRSYLNLRVTPSTIGHAVTMCVSIEQTIHVTQTPDALLEFRFDRDGMNIKKLEEVACSTRCLPGRLWEPGPHVDPLWGAEDGEAVHSQGNASFLVLYLASFSLAVFRIPSQLLGFPHQASHYTYIHICICLCIYIFESHTHIPLGRRRTPRTTASRRCGSHSTSSC